MEVSVHPLPFTFNLSWIVGSRKNSLWISTGVLRLRIRLKMQSACIILIQLCVCFCVCMCIEGMHYKLCFLHCSVYEIKVFWWGIYLVYLMCVFNVFCWIRYYPSVVEKKASFTPFVDFAASVFKICYKQGEVEPNVLTVLKLNRQCFCCFQCHTKPVLPLQDGDTDLCEIAPRSLVYIIHT